MAMQWGPGRYEQAGSGPGTNGGSGGSGGSSCDCNKTCCIASSEAHYQVKSSSGKTAVDAPGGSNSSLKNRISMEFYNAGSSAFEVSNSAFNYGDGSGRPVAPGASYSLDIGPAVTNGGTCHYVQFNGGTGDCRVTELGN